MNKYVIETKQLTKTYGEQTVVNSVNIHVKQGQIYGLLGRNGAGKTTIMKMILGLTDITSGEVDVFGQNIKGREKRVYPRIGAIIETPGFYPNLTGTENLEIFAKLRGTAAPNAVKNALEIVGLPYRDKKLFSKYSLGMKQRLGIANAILHDPELLILDEPTNGLDPIGIAEVRDFIKTLSIERGKTILISSHILSEIALLADDIGIIDHGVLLEENSMNELQKKNSKYILLQVSDIPKTSLVLERQFGVTEYSVQDEHTLRIYDTSLDMAAVNKALVVQDIAVISSQVCNDTLEDYFKKITGGEGIYVRFLGGFRVGYVADVDYDVRAGGLLKRGFERLHQMVRQTADKSYGIDEQQTPSVGKLYSPGGRVEGGEQLILREDVRTGQQVQQRGFPRVGVAYDGSDLHAVLFAAVTRVAAALLKLLQLR